MDVRARLQKLMEERGWSEYRLPKECGLSESTIANIFHRSATPSLATLEAICNSFDITLSHFFAEGDVVEMTPQINELFNGWKNLTSDQKRLILDMIRAFNSNGNKYGA